MAGFYVIILTIFTIIERNAAQKPGGPPGPPELPQRNAAQKPGEHDGANIKDEEEESSKNLMPRAFDVLGPFPHVDGGADVLNAFGGIWEAYSHRVRAKHASELSSNDVSERASHSAAGSTGGSMIDNGHTMRLSPGMTQTTNLLEQVTKAHAGLLPRMDQHGGYVLAEIEQLAEKRLEADRLEAELQSDSGVGRTAYPSEVAPGGLASWSTLQVNFTDWDGEIKMDFADLLESAGRVVGGRKMWQEQGAFGWAVGKFTLAKPATLLARCDTPFLLNTGNVFHTPDVYKEHRAISALNLDAGEHTMAFMAPDGGFWCELFEDKAGKVGAEVRKNLTSTADGSNAESPLVLLSDAQMSDVVDGMLATDYLSIPVLNTLSESLRIQKAELVDAPSWLELADLNVAPIAPGQQVPLRVEMKRPPPGSALPCTNESKFTVSVRFTFEVGKNNVIYAPQIRNLTSNCVGAFEGSAGYLVTYPDFDGSIQRAWVAPPNLTQSEGGACPDGGCPVLLSLHGANVNVDGVGPRTFAYDSHGSFPYAAWLVMPTNRWHWGTDWEGQGLDNAIAALRFVRKTLPGLDHQVMVNQKQLFSLGGDNVTEAEQKIKKEAVSSGTTAWLNARRQRYAPHPARVLLHGHSMGGHGCYLLGTHFPDGLMGMACAAGWSSMQSVHTRLLDGGRDGLRHAPLAEHAADLLAANLFGVPFLVTYGDQDDNVAPDEPRYMARLVRSFSSFGSAIVLREERGVGHWFNQNTPALDAFFRHILHGEGPPAEAAHVAAKAAKVVDVVAESTAAKAVAEQAEKDATEAAEHAKVARQKADALRATADSTGVSADGAAASDSQIATKAEDLSRRSKASSSVLLEVDGTFSDADLFQKPRIHRHAVDSTMMASSRPETLVSLSPEEEPSADDAATSSARTEALAVAASVTKLAGAVKIAAMEAAGQNRDGPHIIKTVTKDNRSFAVDYSSVLAVMQIMKAKAPPPSSAARELPNLPPYFEFIATNPATFGTKGNLQLLQLEAPQGPAKFLVSRQSSALLQDTTVAAALAQQKGTNSTNPVKDADAAKDADATKDSQGEVWVVRTNNVRRFRFKHPPIPGVPVPEALVLDGVQFSGSDLGGPNAPTGRHFCQRQSGDGPKWRICDGTSWAALQRGTPLQGGPLQMAIRRAPVCIVHQGSAHDSEKHAVSLANRMYFVSRYMPTVLNGNEVGPDDSAPAKACAYDSNIILLGHAELNAWSKRLACAFRYVSFLKGGGFALAGERYTAPRSGLLALGGVSDHGRGRRILLAAGTDEAGLAQAVRSVPVSSGQLTPDFAVYGQRASWAGAGGLLAAGFVDHRWHAETNSLSTAFGEPEPPSMGASTSSGSGAAMMQRLSTWGISPKVKGSDFLLGEDACKAEELAALRADDDLYAPSDSQPEADNATTMAQAKKSGLSSGSKSDNAAAADSTPAATVGTKSVGSDGESKTAASGNASDPKSYKDAKDGSKPIESGNEKEGAKAVTDSKPGKPLAEEATPNEKQVVDDENDPSTPDSRTPAESPDSKTATGNEEQAANVSKEVGSSESGGSSTVSAQQPTVAKAEPLTARWSEAGEVSGSVKSDAKVVTEPNAVAQPLMDRWGDVDEESEARSDLHRTLRSSRKMLRSERSSLIGLISRHDSGALSAARLSEQEVGAWGL